MSRSYIQCTGIFEKALHTIYEHVKYQGSSSRCSKVIANVCCAHATLYASTEAYSVYSCVFVEGKGAED